MIKKFIFTVCLLVLLGYAGYLAYFRYGIYLDLGSDKPISTFMKTEGKTILMEKEGEYVPFEIRGVDMGVGIPGHWATDYAVDKETYLRWFQQIQDLGANSIRVYTLLQDDFYNAFYTYNRQREALRQEPLWLIHGVWVNDYMQYSHRDAYDEELLDVLLNDCKSLVDVIHGQRVLSLGEGLGSGSYFHDVSPWVIGYIIGVEWESSLVIYTDQKDQTQSSFEGKYLYTTPDSTAFEAFLCRVGDAMIEYETQRYRQQRLVAFSNWPTTDPFVYPVAVSDYRQKFACVNTERIQPTDAFQSGMFASYHVYPYYPDYLEIADEVSRYDDSAVTRLMGRTVRATLEYRLSLLNAPSIYDYLLPGDYQDSQGRYNTYVAYLRALNRFHTLPVVVTEYGVTTGRGMAQRDVNTGRNQGHMTEQEQGQALIDCYRDIMDAGCAGSCAFTWQDEWFKRTWNTMHAVDLDNTAYWSDYQTNEQFFGLLAFDPGKDGSVCYVDGDPGEWTEEDFVIQYRGVSLSMKYDEKFLYFLIEKEHLNPERDFMCIPLDITPKTGSTYCRDYGGASFERACDFLVLIRGQDNSRLLVQERYEALGSTYAAEFYADDYYINNPLKDSPSFRRVYLPLVLEEVLPDRNVDEITGGELYETGKLRHGNANPGAPDFDSLSDFMFGEDCVEIRLAWQLLNFSNPSEMAVHDDYYDGNYGIENLYIDKLYVGAACYGETKYRVPMAVVPLEGWGKRPTSHERLKRSYYMLRDYWSALDGG